MGTIVYSVRARVPAGEVLSRYLAWLTGGHAQEVVASGAQSARVIVLDDPNSQPGATPDPVGGTRVVVSQYEFADRDGLERYVRGPAVALRAQGAALFAGTGVTFEREVGELVLGLGGGKS